MVPGNPGMMPAYGGMMPGYPGMAMPPGGMGAMPVGAPMPAAPYVGPMPATPYGGPMPPSGPMPGGNEPYPPQSLGPPVPPVPPGMGPPVGFIPVQQNQQPMTSPRLPPAMRGTYTAFTEEQPLYGTANQEYEGRCGCYIGAGAVGFQRQQLSSGTVASYSDSGATALSTSYAFPPIQAGVEAVIGYDLGCGDIEFSGYWVPTADYSNVLNSPGNLNTPFINAPAGFAGLGTLADQVGFTFHTELYNGELLYRHHPDWLGGCSFLFGFRYFGNRETLDITTNALIAQPQDPTQVSDYTVQVHNNLFGPEIGLELHQQFWGWFALDVTSKFMPAADVGQIDRSLQRGDGLVGFDSQTSFTQFSQIYEIGAFLDMYFSTSVKARLGYTVFWVVDVAEASREVNFDLQQHGGYNAQGTAFYFGPSAELSIKF
jgi:hypothetical protein